MSSIRQPAANDLVLDDPATETVRLRERVVSLEADVRTLEISPAAIAKTLIVDGLSRIPSFRGQALAARFIRFIWPGFRRA